MTTKPLMKFKAGQISAAVFENTINANGEEKTILRASVQKRYKDSDGKWKSTNSYSRNEIPLVIHCLQKSFEAILGEKDSKKSGEEEIVM